MKCKKLLSTLLAISVSVSTLAAATITASADSTKKTMNIGSSVISASATNTKDRDIIYYGNQKKWRVLSTNGNTTQNEDTTETATYKDDNGNKIEGPLFVISENNFGKREFDTNESNVWANSSSKGWCEGDFYTAAGITESEKSAILTTSKTDANYSMFGTSGINDKVFYLSANEEGTYFADTYFYDSDDRIFNPGGEGAVWWWLRSPNEYIDEIVGLVNGDGNILYSSASDFNVASRPAFNLNLSSVLFTSAAVGGKSSSAGGGADFFEISAIDNDGKPYEWKLTLKDSENHKNFALGNVKRSGDTLTVAYTGAKTGANEKISYIITDKDQKEIKYYGSQAASSADGSVNITLPTIADTDKLFVFSEQDNGAKKTNYASELKEVTIPAGDFAVTANVNDVTMGSVTSSKAFANKGESVTLTATANDGYKLVGFTSDDVKIYTNGNEGMFTMPEKDVTVTANFAAVGASEITVESGKAFDLEGKEVTASKILVENGGKIKDSSGGKGILKVAREELYGRNYTDQFPLYDEQNGGWRFFDCEIGAGYIEGDSSIIGTTLTFNDAETESIAKAILASDNSGVSVDITLSKTDENGVEHIQTAKAPQSIIKNYANDLTKPILMGVSGLKPGMTISVNYRFANGLVISKEVSNATPYITLEAGADKSYIVKVYGTGLDGVVAVALYNSENQSQLVDVSIQKVAEISGQLQGDGEFVKAMWWEGFDTMKPLCDTIGEDLKIATD